ncbi:MAG: hypothetical protein EOM20_05610 [Spartobacteria bacterium]|nr:hypothetical protein [Spartobacteria bacterium]
MQEKQSYKIPPNDGDYDWEEEVASYVLDALPEERRVAFERIMEESSLCRLKVYEARQLLGALRAVPSAEAVDLLPGVLARLERDEAREPARHGLAYIRRVAAALILVLTAVVFWLQRRSPPPDGAAVAVASARETRQTDELQWLAEQQRQDGSWRCQEARSPQPATVGMTALALLAFLENGPEEAARYQPVIALGVDYLIKHAALPDRADDPRGADRYTSRLVFAALRAAAQSHMLPDARSMEIVARQSAQWRKASSSAWAYSSREDSPRHDLTDHGKIIQQVCRLDFADDRFADSSRLPACREVYRVAMRAMTRDL